MKMEHEFVELQQRQKITECLYQYLTFHSYLVLKANIQVHCI